MKLEPSATTKWNLRKSVNDNLDRWNEYLENENDLLEKENEQYRAFLKEYHAEETFKNWKKEH